MTHTLLFEKKKVLHPSTIPATGPGAERVTHGTRAPITASSIV